MVTIAHRISTIIAYDKVLVLSKGKMVEFGDPWDLLREEEEEGSDKGLFRNMVAESGQEEVLREAAKEAWEKRQMRD